MKSRYTVSVFITGELSPDYTYMAQYCPGAASKNATIDPLAGIEPHARTLNLWRHYQQRKLKARNW